LLFNRHIEVSGDVKTIVNVKLKVKIPFQAHIEEKPKLVPTSVAKVRDYQVDTASFFFIESHNSFSH